MIRLHCAPFLNLFLCNNRCDKPCASQNVASFVLNASSIKSLSRKKKKKKAAMLSNAVKFYGCRPLFFHVHFQCINKEVAFPLCILHTKRASFLWTLYFAQDEAQCKLFLACVQEKNV